MCGSDGLPYTYGTRIQWNTFTCPICNSQHRTTELFQNHLKQHPDHNLDLDNCRTYKDLLLIPGLGHFEINALRGVFKLGWDVILKDVAHLMGFISAKAQDSIRNAYDHHKSWSLFLITLFGTFDEILLSYVSHLDDERRPPSTHFKEWLTTVVDPSFRFLAEYTLEALLPLFWTKAQ